MILQNDTNIETDFGFNIGQSFLSFSEADNEILNKAKELHIKLKTKSETVKSYNSRTPWDKQLLSEAIFYKVYYMCTHAGKISSRGLNSNRRHRATGCPFVIQLRWNKPMRKAVIVSINFNHCGHDISPEVYSTVYSQNRMISEESKQYIHSTLELKPNTQALKRILEDKNPGSVILR